MKVLFTIQLQTLKIMNTATLYYRDIKTALRAVRRLEELGPVIRKEFHRKHIIITLSEKSIDNRHYLQSIDRWAAIRRLWDAEGNTLLQGIILSKNIESKLSLDRLSHYFYAGSSSKRKKQSRISESEKIARLLQTRSI